MIDLGCLIGNETVNACHAHVVRHVVLVRLTMLLSVTLTNHRFGNTVVLVHQFYYISSSLSLAENVLDCQAHSDVCVVC